jgi:hypothetical protein
MTLSTLDAQQPSHTTSWQSNCNNRNKHPEHTVVAAHNNFTLTVAVEKKMRSHSQNPAEE